MTQLTLPKHRVPTAVRHTIPKTPVRCRDTGVSAPPPPPRAALPVLLTAAFVTTLDFFIANVALPAIRADLGAGDGALQLVIAGYGLAYAAGVITAGRLGDLYGARRMFVVGLALFTAASAACGLAPGAGWLVAARIVQGAAAALMAPQVLTLLGVLYPGAARARAFGWYGSAVGVAGVSGQLVGGLLIASDPAGLGWRTCFLINLPLGLAALALVRRALPKDADRARAGKRLDLTGTALVTLGLIALVLPLTLGREQGWPVWSWLSLALAVPLLGGFWTRQRGQADPMVPRELFTGRFTRGLVSVALLFGGSAGLTFVLALHLQEAEGMGPVESAAVFTALNAGFLLGSRLKALLVGALALPAGLVLIAQLGTPVPGLLVAGAAMGMVMSPLLSKVLGEAGGDGRDGAAAGVLGTVQELGGVLGVTVTGIAYFAGGGLTAGLAVLLAASALLAWTLRDGRRPA
ncbi:MFS transporter [Nonomuraea sp. NPDC050310]|uniref:MFS transporter n=1 Tax=Nonomuraea sp. NPDC050310 TaxID=3154935 RepID=UPI0033F38D15